MAVQDGQRASLAYRSGSAGFDRPVDFSAAQRREEENRARDERGEMAEIQKRAGLLEAADAITSKSPTLYVKPIIDEYSTIREKFVNGEMSEDEFMQATYEAGNRLNSVDSAWSSTSEALKPYLEAPEKYASFTLDEDGNMKVASGSELVEEIYKTAYTPDDDMFEMTDKERVAAVSMLPENIFQAEDFSLKQATSDVHSFLADRVSESAGAARSDGTYDYYQIYKDLNTEDRQQLKLLLAEQYARPIQYSYLKKSGSASPEDLEAHTKQMIESLMPTPQREVGATKVTKDGNGEEDFQIGNEIESFDVKGLIDTDFEAVLETGSDSPLSSPMAGLYSALLPLAGTPLKNKKLGTVELSSIQNQLRENEGADVTVSGETISSDDAKKILNTAKKNYLEAVKEIKSVSGKTKYRGVDTKQTVTFDKRPTNIKGVFYDPEDKSYYISGTQEESVSRKEGDERVSIKEEKPVYKKLSKENISDLQAKGLDVTNLFSLEEQNEEGGTIESVDDIF